MKKISAKQQQILDYISSYSLEHGIPAVTRPRIGTRGTMEGPLTGVSARDLCSFGSR